MGGFDNRRAGNLSGNLSDILCIVRDCLWSPLGACAAWRLLRFQAEQRPRFSNFHSLSPIVSRHFAVLPSRSVQCCVHLCSVVGLVLPSIPCGVSVGCRKVLYCGVELMPLGMAGRPAARPPARHNLVVDDWDHRCILSRSLATRLLRILARSLCPASHHQTLFHSHRFQPGRGRATRGRAYADLSAWTPMRTTSTRAGFRLRCSAMAGAVSAVQFPDGAWVPKRWRAPSLMAFEAWSEQH